MHKGIRLSYSCVAGYTTETGSQDGRITCTVKGWSPMPQCYSELILLIPLLLLSGKVNETLLYKCDEGYHTAGGNTTEEAVCLTRGWSLTPNCTNTQQNCTSPPVIRNGILLGPLLTSYKNGSSVEYSCQHYHFLNGPSTVYCEQGNWTQQPTCLEPCTLDATNMNSNNIELKWKQEELIFLHGDLIEFECKQGYSFPQTTISSPGRTQCNHGRVKYPKCIAKGKTLTTFWLSLLIHQSWTYLGRFASAVEAENPFLRSLGFNSPLHNTSIFLNTSEHRTIHLPLMGNAV
uniref:Coagulation factor XIII B chain n=1 Tax=Apteryx owenii TaxID=8824 RepID=A0A8B9NYZ4_APTOW